MTTEHSASTEYTYTYDQYGNITSITDSAGKVTKYYYDDLQQLTREDNPYFGETYVYTYNDAGNRTKKETYTYTTGSLSGASPSKTQSLAYYSATGWYDMLWLCNDGSGGSANGYDAIGNPTTYHTDAASYTFTWQNGRQLATTTKNSTTNIYKYNDSGIRTSKKVGNVEHIYTLNGSQIVSETWGNNTLIYLYDETGSPIGMQYRTSSMEEGEFVNFFFEKNLFGDIVAIYNEAGNKIGSYKYDAWGICTTSVQSTASTFEQNIVRDYNPFRYRGYYYDTETQFYYLQSRYYDPVTGRFLNADGYINANGDLIGFNMYAYCSNNPVMYTDPSGNIAGDVLSPQLKEDLFDPGSVGGGGGAGVIPLYYTIKAIWTAAKALFLYVTAQATLLWATFTHTSSDSIASESVAMEDALADSVSKRNDPDAIYIGIRIIGNATTPVTEAMTFDEAAQWALTQSEYRRKDNWGLYTFNYHDAEIMAIYLASMTNGQYLIEDPSSIKSGHYEHFHTDRKRFGKYKHFHIWYGLPKP